MKRWPAIAPLLFAACALCAPLHAQVRRMSVHPKYYVPGTVTVSATPTTVNLTLAAGAAGSSQAVTISSQWLISLGATVQLYAYFASTTAMTQSGTSSTIPTANVFGQCSTGVPTSYTAFTQTTPFSGASGLQVYSTANPVGIFTSRTDVLNLQINLTTLPQLAAGSYTGTLTLQSVAF